MTPFNIVKTLKVMLGVLIGLSCMNCSNNVMRDNTGNRKAADETYVSQTPAKFEIDAFWPKPLPNNWILGEVTGVSIDKDNNIWIVQRPNSLSDRVTGAMQDPPLSECCIAAPSVMQFDVEGNLLQAWGNPDTTKQWFTSEHGLFVDDAGNVWVSGNGGEDHVVIKFSNDGKFLLQIGEWGKTNGSNDKKLLGAPTDIAVDTKAKEAYISDGYGNRRVIVFDSETGEYKRHWGGYGEMPDDNELPAYDPNGEPSKSFRGSVHSLCISNDSLVYVADRGNNRIQVFKKDGAFVKESFIAKQTLGTGSIWDITFSPDADQTYMYVADGMNMKVWILDRSNMKVVGTMGQGGRGAGQFTWLHHIAMDLKGNLYTTEVYPGTRVQKFKPVAN